VNLPYAILEAFRSIRRVPLMSTVAVGTITLSLMVFGIFLIVTYNVQGALAQVRARVDVEAYLQEQVTGESLTRLRSTIASIPGVESVQYISKEDARARFASEFGEELLTLVEDNPLPASLLITLAADHRTGSGAGEVARRITPMEGIDEVIYGRGWLDRLDQVIVALSAVSVMIGLVVSLASVFVIGNTVKLTVWARRDAVQIMKLVGATDRFIKLPFMIEGVMQGLAGSLLALLVLYGLFLYAATPLGEIAFFPVAVSGAVVALGTVLGGIGSQLSLNRFLEI
jgi:cell division transport system permease protein